MVGISFDPPSVNRAWAEEVGLDFLLLSDLSGEAAKALEAQRDPNDRFVGSPRRITYLIDPDGVVRKAYEVTDIASHPGEVVEDLRRLTR